MNPSQPSADGFQNYPKVELHRHLEGSLRLSTMMDIARAHSIDIPSSLGGLVQVQDEDPLTFQNFLAKFATLRLFYRSPEAIHRITREAIEDAASDNLRYMELRFTPVALSRAERFPLHDVVDWVVESTQEASEKYHVKVGLIASMNRHESTELAEQVAWLAAEHVHHGIVGLDLAGNEAEFPAEPFIGIFKEAHQSGLMLTIHAGEWGPAKNVREAIELFDADRIGHGVRVIEDESVIALARERNIPLEVCITSNYQSGVTPALLQHPLLRLIQNNLNVTINTDDPSVSRITLSDEYKVACTDLGLPEAVLKERIVAAAQAAFLNETEKAELVKSIKAELKM